MSSTEEQQIRLGVQLEAADREYTRPLLRDPALLAAGLDDHYALRPHLRLIGQEYARLLAQPDARLLIMTPPQCGKTTTAVEWGTLFWLANNPKHRVVIGSYNRDLAARAGTHIRELIIRHGRTVGLELTRGDMSKQDFSVTSGAGVRSVGVMSGLTGHPAHLAVLDDPHKDRAEAESVRIRDNVWDWYSSVLLSRFQPQTRMVLILTRWHPDDLAGRLLEHEGRVEEGGTWRVLHLPAIADTDLTRYGDPLGRETGDPLPHPNVPEGDTTALARFWQQRRRQTPLARDWASLYQGDPKPAEGALVTAELLRSIRVLDPGIRPGTKRRAVAVDPGGGGRDTVGIVAGYLAEDDRLWITHDRSDSYGVDVWPRVVCELAAEVDADLVLYEHNFGAAMPQELIRAAWDRLEAAGTILRGALPPLIEKVHARQGKYLRAEHAAQAMHEDRVRLAAYMPELETEWATWQPTDPNSPGRIDASTYLARWLLPGPKLDQWFMAPGDVEIDEAAWTPSWLSAAGEILTFDPDY